jgi:cell wall-associated NlpC family hydrolase
VKLILSFICVVLMAGPATAQMRKKTTEPSTAEKSSASKTKATGSGQKTTGEAAKKSTTKTKSASTKTAETTAEKKTTTKPADAATKSSTTSGAKKSTTSTKTSGTTAKKKSSEAVSGEEKAKSEEETKKAEGEKTAKKSADTKDTPTSEKPVEKPPQDNAGDDPVASKRPTGANVTLLPEDLVEFDAQSEPVQKLIRNSLALTERNLTYRYGSSDPNSGGMDCSGTIYYLLKQSGIKEPPRDSSGLYLWAEKTGTLRSVNVKDLEDRALADLKPGDLLFWEGTYEVQRDPPISHTMIYLGREKKTGLRVMVGASDGRTYGGVSRNGVSVFDFRLPRAESTAKFVGYARVPGFDHSVRRRSVENQ